MVQSNLKDDQLDCYHEERLYQQGDIEVCAGVVEYSAQHIALAGNRAVTDTVSWPYIPKQRGHEHD